MRHTSRTARILATAAAGSLVLAACGGSNETASGGTPSAGAAASACDSFTKAPPPAKGTKITPPTGVSKSTGVLTIGSVLPQTGNLAFLGPPEFAGVKLAIKDINAAGGALGKPVKYIEGDSGDAQQDVANPTVDRLIKAGANVLIGAASSGVTKTFLD
ncbi:MAG: ABC transporter substrate-binding protein, partial [Frankiales bacterium]|nr:ABC transporter substrate-binding protein [Frankiales bacterium]